LLNLKHFNLYLNKAIELKPDYAAPYSNLSTIFFKDSKRLDETETYFEVIIILKLIILRFFNLVTILT